MSAFVSRFQQLRIRELSEFFGQESYRPPSPKVPVRQWAMDCATYSCSLPQAANNTVISHLREWIAQLIDEFFSINCCTNNSWLSGLDN